MHQQKILVTGSEGLIGSALSAALTGAGHEVRGLDLRGRGPDKGDTRNLAELSLAVEGCDGVVHLAALSRVVWAEKNVDDCHETNVAVLDRLLKITRSLPLNPWVIFASSREVYGQPASFPVNEDSPLLPMNVYARSKALGEHLCGRAAAEGARVAVVRLSNVFGSIADHPDRVIPAFVRAALAGRPLRVEGATNTFDFTHVDDVVRGLALVIAAMSEGGAALPTTQFVTGVPTSLGQLASLILRLSGSTSPLVDSPPRSFDVSHFVGDPSRAQALLGWRPCVSLEQGLRRLIAAFAHASAEAPEPALQGVQGDPSGAVGCGPAL